MFEDVKHSQLFGFWLSLEHTYICIELIHEHIVSPQLHFEVVQMAH